MTLSPPSPTARLLARTAAALVLLGAAAIACAHSFHAGLADITYNARTGSTEVVHTYMTHDVEALLVALYGRQFDLTDPDDQAALRKYVEQQFWLGDDSGKHLALNWVGLTVDTDSVVIYQEAVQTPANRVASIHDAVLTDFLADQANTVNLTVDAKLRTFVFDSRRKDYSIR